MRRAAGVAAMLLLAGCSAVPPPSASPAPAPPVWNGIPITHPHVLLSCPALEPVHLDAVPDDLVEVRRCTADVHEVQGVLNRVQYVQRLTSDADAVLTAYTAADDSATGATCGDAPTDPRILWLELASGDVVAVRAPADGCGHPLDAAATAYDAAEFETILVAREVASTLDD